MLFTVYVSCSLWSFKLKTKDKHLTKTEIQILTSPELA